jgi:hypothetical protein
MSKLQKQTEIDSIVDLIEQMIDVRFKMLLENQYNNYRQSLSIKENQYNPVVEELKLRLEKLGVDFNSGQ